jgi:branched-chain amino acid transport system ATP-binding protein
MSGPVADSTPRAAFGASSGQLGVSGDSQGGASSDDVSSSPRPAVLAARDVSVRFGGITAVNRVTTEILADEVCGLIGPNGAGKTTLFDTLAGLSAPSSGVVELDGVDITRRSATWRSRHGIRRTFQRHQPFGWLSVEDNILVAMEWRGGGGGPLADLVYLPSRTRRERQRRIRVDEVMELCGIGHLRNEAAGRLPIGQIRMVEIARAIVDRPRVLLLDEPTSGLDEAEMPEVGAMIEQIRREEACGIVLVEHNVGFVMQTCSRIVVLDLGRIIAEGTPELVRKDAAVAEAYLG